MTREKRQTPINLPKCFWAIQSFFLRISVGLLSYNSRSTLIRLDASKKLNGKTCDLRFKIQFSSQLFCCCFFDPPLFLPRICFLKTQYTTRPYFFCISVVLELIWYHKRATREIKSNTTGWPKKNRRVFYLKCVREIISLCLPDTSCSYFWHFELRTRWKKGTAK